jgi:hypothetical protein
MLTSARNHMSQFKNYDQRIEFLQLNERIDNLIKFLADKDKQMKPLTENEVFNVIVAYNDRIERLNKKVDDLVADVAKITKTMYEMEKVLAKMPIYANSKG